MLTSSSAATFCMFMATSSFPVGDREAKLTLGLMPLAFSANLINALSVVDMEDVTSGMVRRGPAKMLALWSRSNPASSR